MFAARHLPEENWPDASDSGIRSWLDDLCMDKTSFEELRRVDWVKQFRRRLGRLADVLDKEVPGHIRLPGGSRARVDYSEAGGPRGLPVLAIYIQQAFGLHRSPRVARGRVQLLLHLLAPNGRPAQITTDLESFWQDTYPEVRKELRARYPKHAWPRRPL